jgi:hypothetical protein
VFPVAVAAAAAAGWLLLFFVLLALPPASQPSPEEGVTPGTEPPAAVSLLAKRLDRDGFGVTLADLAARGWFRLSGTPGPAGPVMCMLPAEAPAESLVPYERRVMAHVARRAGTRSEVPAPALSDGFEGGKEAFMTAFGKEVTADAERRGLTRPRLSGRRIGLLCLVLLVPAGASTVALTAAHQRYPLAWTGVSWVVVALITGGIGAGRRPSAAGRAVLDRWHAAADEWRRGGTHQGGAQRGGAGLPGADARLQAYAAALGRAPGAVATFEHAGQNMVWSSYRGSWQQLPVETRGGSWPLALAWTLAIIFGPFVLIGGVAALFAEGLGWLGERIIGLAGGAALVGVAIWAVRRLTPRFAEFDGQVIRQTFYESDDGPDEYKVVVDDGVRAAAWDLKIPAGAWRQMPSGTLVHARVNLHNREVTIHPVEPAAMARPLAHPGVPFDPRGGAGDGGSSPDRSGLIDFNQC